MAKVKTHFSRRARFFVVEDMTSEDGFDAYPVEIDESVIARLRALKVLLDRMYDVFEVNPAPEECAQSEADLLAELVEEVWNG